PGSAPGYHTDHHCTVSGMTSTVSTSDVSLKSGSNESVRGSILLSMADSPPTAGWRSATIAAPITPIIASANCTMSVPRTPQSPATEAKSTAAVPATTIVSTRPQPSITFAILTAASVTVDMIMMLKKSPRYTARNPRTTAAGFPEYRSS